MNFEVDVVVYRPCIKLWPRCINKHKLCSSKVSTTLSSNTKPPVHDNKLAGCHSFANCFSNSGLSPQYLLRIDQEKLSLLRATAAPFLKNTTSRPLEPHAPTMLSALQNPRQAAAQLLNFGLILSTAFMMWKGLSVIADSPSPIVVVLSGSMEPAFQRGDLLFLWNRNLLEETKVGEIVVYNVKGKDIPIVHRVVRKFGVG